MLRAVLFFSTIFSFFAYAECASVRLIATKTDDNNVANFVAQGLLASNQINTQLIDAASPAAAYKLLSSQQADAYLSTWVFLDRDMLKPYLLNGKIKTWGKVLSNMKIGIAGNSAAVDAGIISLSDLDAHAEKLGYTIYVPQQDWYYAQLLESIIHDNIYHLSHFYVIRIHDNDFKEVLSEAEEERRPIIFFTREISRLTHKFAVHFLYNNYRDMAFFQGQTDVYSTVNRDFPKRCDKAAALLKTLDLNHLDIEQFLSIERGIWQMPPSAKSRPRESAFGWSMASN